MVHVDSFFRKWGDLPRKTGDLWNMRSHDAQYIDEHVEVWTPGFWNSRTFLVCRCFKSDRFPLCDQSHGEMVMQGAKIGPCLLEVRKNNSFLEKYWYQSTPGAWPSEFDRQDPKLVSYPAKPEEATEYLHHVDVNLRRFHDYHHVVETYPEVGDKKVRICRCWQSKRFPICDDTHKQLYEGGDPVGPYVALLRGKKQTPLKNVSAITGRVASKAASGASAGVAMMLGVAGVAGAVGLLGSRLFGKKEDTLDH